MSNGQEDFGFVYQERTGTCSRGSPPQIINDLDFADDIALLEQSIKRAFEQLSS
jgi:hypothetical protein